MKTPEANKFLEENFFNRHFFLEAIKEANHPIDFIADLMEEYHRERLKLLTPTKNEN
jgi:hypothetical protein